MASYQRHNKMILFDLQLSRASKYYLKKSVMCGHGWGLRPHCGGLCLWTPSCVLGGNVMAEPWSAEIHRESSVHTETASVLLQREHKLQQQEPG